jgi:hypothetical protein
LSDQRLTTLDINELLLKHDGNLRAAADEADITPGYLKQRIRATHILDAIWGEGKVIEPNSPESEMRSVSLMEELGLTEEFQMIKANGEDIFESAIEDIVVNKDNIGKLKVFDGMKGNLGLVMSRALELTNTVAVRQNVSLFEMSELLKSEILSKSLNSDQQAIKMRQFIMCCDQQGKFYERLLRGMECMLKLHEKNKKKRNGGKRKPGFSALKDKDRMEAKEAETE